MTQADDQVGKKKQVTFSANIFTLCSFSSFILGSFLALLCAFTTSRGRRRGNDRRWSRLIGRESRCFSSCGGENLGVASGLIRGRTVGCRPKKLRGLQTSRGSGSGRNQISVPIQRRTHREKTTRRVWSSSGQVCLETDSLLPPTYLTAVDLSSSVLGGFSPEPSVPLTKHRGPGPGGQTSEAGQIFVAVQLSSCPAVKKN